MIFEQFLNFVQALCDGCFQEDRFLQEIAIGYVRFAENLTLNVFTGVIPLILNEVKVVRRFELDKMPWFRGGRRGGGGGGRGGFFVKFQGFAKLWLGEGYGY